MNAIELLRKQMEEAWGLVERAMVDVNDDMLHWEPAPGSWGLRLRKGRWQPDYHIPDPIPPGPKTIGWLAAHIAACKEMYYEYAFGPRQKNWDDLNIPGDVEGLHQYLKRTHEPFKHVLDQLDESDLKVLTSTNWGEEKPIWWILWTMIYHDLEHGGQIFQVKNEYINKTRYPKRRDDE